MKISIWRARVFVVVNALLVLGFSVFHTPIRPIIPGVYLVIGVALLVFAEIRRR